MYKNTDMYKKGHIGINMILFSPILFVMMILDFFVLGIIGFITVIYFASLPDIDLKTKRLSHRGFTHTISFAFIIGFITLFIGMFINSILLNIGIIPNTAFSVILTTIYSFFIGFFIVIGHIIGDIITPSGVKIFQKPKYIPDLFIFSDKKYSLNLIKAKNKIANIAFLIIGIFCTILSFYSGLFLLII